MKLALHWKIIIGMLLGVVAALMVLPLEGGKAFIIDWIKPFGNIFISTLKLIAVPLIIASLIKGISDLKDTSSLSKMGSLTITIYIITTVVAVCIGLGVANVIKPGHYITEKTRNNLLANYIGSVDSKIKSAESQKESGPLQALEDMVPSNIFEAASDNGKMLQVIFFSIFFGIAIILLPEEQTTVVKSFFDGVNHIILKMIDLIMKVSPYGVFALLASLVVEAPSLDLFKALGIYAFAVILGLIVMLGFYALIVKFLTKESPIAFFRGILPAQLFAFTTSSSAATLPVTIECVEDNLKVSKKTASFVLPIGATINMDGTSVYQAVAALFIAQAFGLDLSFSAQMGIIATATLASIGSAAVPGAGMVMLVIVLSQAGIPEAGLALIFAIDRPLDMCRTMINITGDSAVSLIVDRKTTQTNQNDI
ncbi:MAG: dicarboxylate/amino acid:cation symporter [Flavobacteriales bacterium]|nr:dicarboxylate/amino acid:cation symporter [Flavobacteriales bacterium]